MMAPSFLQGTKPKDWSQENPWPQGQIGDGEGALFEIRLQCGDGHVGRGRGGLVARGV